MIVLGRRMEVFPVAGEGDGSAYSQTRLIRTLLIRHFCLIHRRNLKTLKPLPLTPMLNQPFN